MCSHWNPSRNQSRPNPLRAHSATVGYRQLPSATVGARWFQRSSRSLSSREATGPCPVLPRSGERSHVILFRCLHVFLKAYKNVATVARRWMGLGTSPQCFHALASVATLCFFDACIETQYERFNHRPACPDQNTKMAGTKKYQPLPRVLPWWRPINLQQNSRIEKQRSSSLIKEAIRPHGNRALSPHRRDRSPKSLSSAPLRLPGQRPVWLSSRPR